MSYAAMLETANIRLKRRSSSSRETHAVLEQNALPSPNQTYTAGAVGTVVGDPWMKWARHFEASGAAAAIDACWQPPSATCLVKNPTTVGSTLVMATWPPRLFVIHEKPVSITGSRTHLASPLATWSAP